MASVMNDPARKCGILEAENAEFGRAMQNDRTGVPNAD